MPNAENPKFRAILKEALTICRDDGTNLLGPLPLADNGAVNLYGWTQLEDAWRETGQGHFECNVAPPILEDEEGDISVVPPPEFGADFARYATLAFCVIGEDGEIEGDPGETNGARRIEATIDLAALTTSAIRPHLDSLYRLGWDSPWYRIGTAILAMGLGLCTQADYEEVVGWARNQESRLPFESEDLDWPLFASTPEQTNERAHIYRGNQDCLGWPRETAWCLPFG